MFQIPFKLIQYIFVFSNSIRHQKPDLLWFSTGIAQQSVRWREQRCQALAVVYHISYRILQIDIIHQLTDDEGVILTTPHRRTAMVNKMLSRCCRKKNALLLLWALMSSWQTGWPAIRFGMYRWISYCFQVVSFFYGLFCFLLCFCVYVCLLASINNASNSILIMVPRTVL